MPQQPSVCECQRMTALLRRMGAHHAAKMHDTMSRYPEYAWSKEDWLQHFLEEEKFVFPVMVRAGMRAQAQQLGRDHARFREQFRRHGTVSKKELDAHAELEDSLVLLLEGWIPPAQPFHRK